MSRRKSNPAAPNTPGEKILIAIARHHALTVNQTAVLCFFTKTSCERGTEDVFFLDEKGKRYLAGIGVPYDEKTGHRPPKGLHLAHRSAVTWVLIAMERAGVELLEVVNEWRLSRIGVKVKLPGGELVKYSPDAFVRFRVPGEEEPYAIAIELDRGTEHLKDWARKADEMVAFASRDEKGRYPFQQLFAVDRLRYAVISAPGAIGAVDYRTRAGNLLTWTAHRLEQTGKEAWARNFFVRPFDARLCFPDPKGNPAQCTPAGLLRDPSWVVPGETEGRPLIGGRP